MRAQAEKLGSAELRYKENGSETDEAGNQVRQDESATADQGAQGRTIINAHLMKNGKK